MCWNRDPSHPHHNKITRAYQISKPPRTQDLVNPNTDRSHFFITYSLVWLPDSLPILRDYFNMRTQHPDCLSLTQHKPNFFCIHLGKTISLLLHKIESHFIASLTTCPPKSVIFIEGSSTTMTSLHYQDIALFTLTEQGKAIYQDDIIFISFLFFFYPTTLSA